MSVHLYDENGYEKILSTRYPPKPYQGNFLFIIGLGFDFDF